MEVISFLEEHKLPLDEDQANKVAIQFVMVVGVLFFIDSNQDRRRRVVVPKHLQQTILDENHCSHLDAHFSYKLFKALCCHWWWERMFSDVVHYIRNCPECAVVSGGAKAVKPLLHPIPVQKPFQVVGVDVM